ncbi:hypothetical protein Htur_2167 [Haloterrigena turkmenica DSM 5511]|uniref:Cell surface glycoprotein n=1 Tax=Haloterrigena turkmenica (strain ATCC 51198 / DSM 5511 / JCM 9101 / NCIMB 13204 / VKM B-1734 / 4k) TaxID=543526 RepID=D2RTU7_HALTV|nr:hypothetical protein [Haloterrigena turkmenica]ADB61048.1 hypothetical protein Htur_2167 [Haloterrigena turkmenica DSM 5511]
MRRRRLLLSGGVVLGTSLGTTPVTAALQDDTDDDREEPDPIEFSGDGVTVTEEFEIEGGPTVIEGVHEGTSTFDVRAVPNEHEQEYRLLSHIGGFDGSTGAFLEDGAYVLYVDADGPWELIVRQPRVSETEAEEPPVSISGSGTDWIGPVLLDGDATVGAVYDAESPFRIAVVPQDAENNDFVWNGQELVFDAIGAFAGVTAIHTDGVGYVTVDAADEWTIEIE